MRQTINGHPVSLLCLGTMTWGEQNTETEAHAQLDFALAQGINFLDCAEMYPVPPKAETQGLTEAYIGSWLAKTQRRKDWFIATKATGGSRGMDYLRGGPRHTREQIIAACDASLKRLQTDHIDLYQLHWPDRNCNIFGQLNYVHQEVPETPLEETARALEALIREGKIGSYGVSNESPWGLMTLLKLAETGDLPRPCTIQNAYNLLNRVFEIGLAEIAHRESVGLLAYSPLAMGLLTGKYRHGARPAGSRLHLFDRFTRYESPQCEAATEAYCKLAEDAGLTPTAMALAFVNSRPFLTANIIGATSLDQLEDNIASLSVTLSQDVLDEIERIHRQYPNPAP
jgi:aryl-alcohol dehydrogenase-like predicted oxidoreductase